MIVFKTFLKVLKKNIFTILIFTIFLIFFGTINLQTSESNLNFEAAKPDIVIINQDEEKGIVKNLTEYMKRNSNVKEIEMKEEKIKDALFYREISYVITIPSNYRNDFLQGKNPMISVKSTGDFESSQAEILLNRYLKIANIYQKSTKNEGELIKKINDSLKENIDISITSKVDTSKLSKATFYFNFASYSILAGCVYVICLVLSTFRETKIMKRTKISSMKITKYNRILFLSNFLFAFVLWFIYILIATILLGNIVLNMHGLFYIINSFLFTLCAVSIAFLIGNLVTNKEAINGIVNVVALGSSFLCGAFVPMQWLPDFVLKIGHFLPSYWYIKNNELLKETEIFNTDFLTEFFFAGGVLIFMTILLFGITNYITRKKRS